MAKLRHRPGMLTDNAIYPIDRGWQVLQMRATGPAPTVVDGGTVRLGGAFLPTLARGARRR
jgi:hypothetical protein